MIDYASFSVFERVLVGEIIVDVRSQNFGTLLRERERE